MARSYMLVESVVRAEGFWAATAMVRSLHYSMIDVNVLISLRFFVYLKESSVYVNGVVCPAIFLLESTVIVIVIFIVLKLTEPVCGLSMVCPSLLRVAWLQIVRLRIVRPVSAFILLVVRLASLILIRPTIQICVSGNRLQRWTLVARRSLCWNHSDSSRSLLVGIRWRVPVNWTKRKRGLRGTLNWTVWRNERGLTIRRLILRLIRRLIWSLTRKIRTKTAILTIPVSFYSRASIITFSITLTTHTLSITAIRPVHVPPSILLEF